MHPYTPHTHTLICVCVCGGRGCTGAPKGGGSAPLPAHLFLFPLLTTERVDVHLWLK